MALILCTGNDLQVMQERKQLLEQAGHTVITATNEGELVAACEGHQFDVVIIGQTLGPQMKQHVADFIRRYCPRSKVLELYSPSAGRAVPYVDSWIPVRDHPTNELADRVNELTKAA
jgi:CheY-like chemotaxis protein